MFRVMQKTKKKVVFSRQGGGGGVVDGQTGMDSFFLIFDVSFWASKLSNYNTAQNTYMMTCS